MTYPAQLQRMLGEQYIVTNLGACAAAMQQHADTPYWKRLQWQVGGRSVYIATVQDPSRFTGPLGGCGQSVVLSRPP